MKAALIPPRGLERSALDSDIHLILPLPACTSNANYMQVYREARHRGDYLILDNGCAEGDLVDTETLLRVAKQLRVHEIVAPDVMGDSELTWGLTGKFLADNVPEITDYSLMAVLQGRSYSEALGLAEAFAADKRITTFGIPKVLIDREGDDVRARLAKVCLERWPEIKIHLLGLSNKFPTEMLDVVFPKGIRSMDSAQPYKMAERGVLMTAFHCKKYNPRRRADYFERPATTNLNILKHNIAQFKAWCE